MPVLRRGAPTVGVRYPLALHDGIVMLHLSYPRAAARNAVSALLVALAVQHQRYSAELNAYSEGLRDAPPLAIATERELEPLVAVLSEHLLEVEGVLSEDGQELKLADLDPADVRELLTGAGATGLLEVCTALFRADALPSSTRQRVLAYLAADQREGSIEAPITDVIWALEQWTLLVGAEGSPSHDAPLWLRETHECVLLDRARRKALKDDADKQAELAAKAFKTKR